MVSLIKASKRNKAGTLSFTIPTEIMANNTIKKGQLFVVTIRDKNNILYSPAKNNNDKNVVKASPRNKKGTLSFTIPKVVIEILEIKEKDPFLVYPQGKSIRFEKV
jgi:hypothetical protein